MRQFQNLDRLQSYDLGLNLGLLAVTMVVLSTLYAVAVRPIDRQLADARQQTSALEQLIRKTSEIALKRETLESELKQSEQATEELLQRIPTAPRESDFLAHVCRLADRTGMAVAHYHPGVIEARENHHEMEVKLSTRGEYASLCKFLEQVDHLPRLSRLTQLEVATPAKGEELTVDLSFRLYFASPNETDTAKKG